MQPLSVAVVVASPELLTEVQACLRECSARIVIEQPQIGDWNGFIDRVERMRPDVVLLEVAPVWEQLEETFRKIRQTPAAPAIVALHAAKDAETILRAIRAGATEYLYPPLVPSMASALGRIAGERKPREEHRSRGRVFAFFSAKGGCGATTIACHTGIEMQKVTGKEVLLADFDLDAGILGFLMKSKTPYTVLEAMNNAHRLDLSYWKALVSNGIPGVEVIPAPTSFATRPAHEHERIRHVLRFVRGHYDWVVADLGRSLSANVLSALEEVDETCLVTTVDVPALYRARQIVRGLLDSGYRNDRLHIILNRVPRNSDVTAAEIQQMMGVPVKAAIPDDFSTLYECYADGKLLPSNSGLGRHMTTLAGALTGTPQKAKRSFGIFG